VRSARAAFIEVGVAAGIDQTALAQAEVSKDEQHDHNDPDDVEDVHSLSPAS
jgi:hypothetical protein